MSQIRVGVLRGGPGGEYDVSLQSGKSVLANLSREKYDPLDVLITKSGTWHLAGLPTNPDRLARQVDVVFNALHGEFGEDGRVQSLLDAAGIPYTGSGIFASAIGMKKHLAKNILAKQSIRAPLGVSLDSTRAAEDNARQAFLKISPPWVVKPDDRGSSLGVFLARTFAELVAVLEQAFAYSNQAMVEEYVAGREATCGVVDNFRGEEHYALPAIEIRRPAGKAIWEYDDKYSGATEEVCPGCFNDEEKAELARLAVAAHRALGMRHYSRSDFIIPASPAGRSPRGIYWLEINSLPGLTSESLFPRALEAVGCSYGEFLDHLISEALNHS